ncbi:ATP-binding protein [Mucilaginibacter terrae]|uniref:Serine/threonine-protein kinase RsbW n=1 Tax=Mucilaginibacter terrae TaxID=1955052 RepID=A0ABU3GPW6_9SPHI|nr:ATP-binding protein [Mucilaginibacter terrae]MDT3401526.1 serine/threonine-protein kinase RsbW [Mucilaginibacter terrae]
MDTIVKSFPATLDSLEPIRNFVSEKSAALGLNKKKTYGLCLAIDEIATNIINYGYPKAGITNGEVQVTVNISDKSIEVILGDQAVAFDPLQHLVPSAEDMNKPLEERPIGGLGILLAQQNVDEFTYDYKNGSNYNRFLVNATA